MLRRDFTKTNREYFKQNRIALISVALFLVIGMILLAIFGLNGNFEVGGYKEFTINVNSTMTKDFSKHQQEVSKIINSYNGKFDNMSVYGEGDNTQYVVRYLKDVKGNDIIEINQLVAEKLEVDVEEVSTHIKVKPSAKNTDYIYTILAILLIVLTATIFAFIRYNGASAMSIIIACLLGNMAILSINAMLRILVGMSFFAMLIILNVLICYSAINLFENMHKSSWLVSGDYQSAMDNGLKLSKTRMYVTSIGLMAIGIFFVLFGTYPIKYISLNIMFMAVVLLAVSCFVVPFVWNVFIPHCRKREYKIKATVEDKK